MNILNKDEILIGLNPDQQEAVKHIKGPALVTATAGSGKTRVIVSRAQNMILEGIDPSKILLTTFTNKAANEMKQRIVKAVGDIGNNITVGTFHSICNKILRTYAEKINYNRYFTILDESESDKIIEKLCKKYELEKKFLKNFISYNKCHYILPSMAIKRADNDTNRKMATCYQLYQETLKNQMSMDFDDLLLNTVILLENNPDVKRQINNKWEYISADENQDSSDLDAKLLELLAGEKQNIFLVGDDYQCLTPDTLISTEYGSKRIDELKEDDNILVASGRGKTTIAPIDSISVNDVNKEIIKIVTQSGKTLKLTPEHILFSKIEPLEDKYYVYLMYRKDKGYRIGRTSSIRNRKSKKTNGFEVRLNQERGEKIWLLESLSCLEESIYYEQYYSYKYGIPQYRFESEGVALSQNGIDKLFASIDTNSRAEQLLHDKGLFLEYPHHTPQATTRFNRDTKRIMFNMFGEKRKGYEARHTINICCKDENFFNLSKEILNRGYKKDDYYMIKKASLNYDELMEDVNLLEEKINNSYNYNIDYNARLTLKDKNYKLTPASNIMKDFIVCVKDENNEIVEEKVTSVEKFNYNGKVYDLNINNYRNYIANGIVVHNCIYGFRGSNIENILNLQKKYPNIKIYNLGINYRSTNTIIEAGKSIIKYNKNQLEKSVSCGRVDNQGNPIKGLPIVQTKCKDQKDEALKIVAYINMLKNKKNIPLNEIAILFRMTNLTRTVEEALMKSQINYNLIGGTPFFSRMEIQDILSYARLTVNPYDLQAFKRSIAIPKRGVGAKTIEKIEEFCFNNPIGIMAVREALNKKELNLKGKAKSSIEEYNNFLKELDKQKMLLSPKDFLMYIAKEINYYKYLEENYEDNFLERIENLEELFNAADEYNTIDELITQASLFKDDIEDENNKEAVQLMTLHKSKGLEFQAVIMTNMCEGTLPHRKSLEDVKELEEERRLAFVGVTRAENYLFMTYPQKQKIMGQWMYAKPSRFLQEIDPRLIYKN